MQNNGAIQFKLNEMCLLTPISRSTGWVLGEIQEGRQWEGDWM
jgi:hypothetical protein